MDRRIKGCKMLHDKLKLLAAEGFQKLRIVVAGDLMLDHYIYGAVRRISPEAPVPVIEFEKDFYMLGGAGNVARNLISLGVNVSLLSAVGSDRSGEIIRSLPDLKDVDISGLLTDAQRMTTVKERILSGSHQQMLRLDYEKKELLGDKACLSVLDIFRTFLERGIDALIISDYGKGFCTESLCRDLISECCNKNVPVFVDPKGNSWSHYAGAFMITPNLKELSDVMNSDIPNRDDEIVCAAKYLLTCSEINNILVTRSDRGATLVNKTDVIHQKCKEQQVFDVSGAGDTVISTIATFLTSGESLADSVFAANVAAQLVIRKVGTSTVTARELVEALEDELEPTESIRHPGAKNSKLLTLEDAVRLTEQWKKDNERVIFTNGCFDLLHAGHIDSILAARALGDRLIIGLNSDESVTRLKGEGRPVYKAGDRAKMLEALEAVDAVVIFEQDTPKELLSRIRPAVIAKGGDYTPDMIEGGEYADEIVILPLIEGYSTSSVIHKLESGDYINC